MNSLNKNWAHFLKTDYFENQKFKKISLLEVGHLLKRNEKDARLIFKSEKLLSNNQKVV